MPAYMEIDGISGEVQQEKHKKWISLDSLSQEVFRSIPVGAKGVMRTQGDTTLGDCVVIRKTDATTPKLQEKCATGEFIKKVKFDFCATLGGKQVSYMLVTIEGVIITGHTFNTSSGGSQVTEEVTMGYTKIAWKYTEIDHETGKTKGSSEKEYEPSKD